MTTKWEPDQTSLYNTIFEKAGNISAIAKKYNISRDCFHRYIKERADIRALIKEAREQAEEDDLDRAEALNRYFMGLAETNPTLASKHCIYTLESKGKKRNWGHVEVTGAPNDVFLDATFELIEKESEIAKLRAEISELKFKYGVSHDLQSNAG